jgi:hypothetical protein
MKMENENELFRIKEELGLYRPKPQFDFEKLKQLNPGLTKPIFNFLNNNGGLWKVFCGKEVKMKYSKEYMPPLWFLDCEGCKAEFYDPSPDYLKNIKVDS